MSNIQLIKEIKDKSPPVNPEPITLTEKAVDMVIEAMDSEGLKDHSLRVGVRGGGCSGLQYNLEFDKEPRDDDFVFEQQGARDTIKVFIDPFSASLLEGTVLKWHDSLQQSGFKFDSPLQSKRTCGCGKSFGY